MSEITYKRTGELLKKLFGILTEYPEGLPAWEAIEKLAGMVTLTSYEAGNYESSGTRRFDKIVRFATVNCTKAGWLLKKKGVWSLTDAGTYAYKTFPDGEALYREAVRLYGIWKSTKTGMATGAQESAPSVEEATGESATVSYEEADEQARKEIEKYLHAMPPYEFQDLVGDLLTAMGYYVAWIAPPGKDGGIDIIAYNDPLGTKPPRIKVQVRRVEQKVDVNALKSFVAGITARDVGIFVSAGGFTKDAEEFARHQAQQQITLIDLNDLIDLWRDNFGKLSEVARRRLPLTPIYFLTPEE